MKNGIIQSNIFRIALLGAVLSLNGLNLFSQNTSLLADGVDDFIRRSQLKGSISVQASLTRRSFATNITAIDSLLKWKNGLAFKTGSAMKVTLSPVSVAGQYNSHHAYGWNDGAMIPAKGVQTILSAGVEVVAGNFVLQLKPEFVYAQNPVFETFPTEHYDPYWEQYYRWLNTSDIPERFGNKTYKKFYGGQSSLRYNKGALSVGISTENLWWGPGMRNALVMSNNAPGFLHGTLNTTRPIETGIGSFEGQIIAGSLASSGILPPERNRYYTNNQPVYIPKREESRYIAGMVLSWQPKWIKGLFVGFAKASYLYKSDIGGIADILPLDGIIKSSAEKNHKKASLGSLFVRYVLPEEKAELYIEYGRNDKSPNLINVAADNGYPRAYVAGFRKLFSARRDANIEFMCEFTQMQLPTADLVFSGRSWYTDTSVRHGYTNQGQVLGAGIGPGTNSQMIDISWVKGYNKIGLMFERILHNNDFYYNAFSQPVAPNDYTRHWVDISTTAHIDWKFHNFLLSSQLGVARSINYQWFIFQQLQVFSNGYDVLNFHGRLSLSYKL